MKAEGYTHEVLIAAFGKCCKKFTFQLEKGEGGFVHYQCRISLIKKKTQNECIKSLTNAGLGGFHVSPSSTNSLKGDDFYACKEDTRVEGPWTDKDEKRPELKTVSKMDAGGLLPWQADLLGHVQEYDDRKIHIVVDRQGNIGKSAFCKYVWAKKLGQPVPPMTTAEDLTQFVMCMGTHRLYVIDMPRAMKKKGLYGLYSGIENVKNGMLFDKRYKGVFKYIDEPNIIVFTNTPPKLSYLSRDRWKLWTVQDNQLVVYKYGPKPGAQVDVGTHP